MGLSSKGVAIVSVRVVAVECILCKSNRFVMNDLLNKLVKPFEHLLESDHKCLFLKLFYSASHLSIAVFNIMPRHGKLILFLMVRMKMEVLTWCQPLRGDTRCY